MEFLSRTITNSLYNDLIPQDHIRFDGDNTTYVFQGHIAGSGNVHLRPLGGSRGFTMPECLFRASRVTHWARPLTPDRYKIAVTVPNIISAVYIDASSEEELNEKLQKRYPNMLGYEVRIKGKPHPGYPGSTNVFAPGYEKEKKDEESTSKLPEYDPFAER